MAFLGQVLYCGDIANNKDAILFFQLQVGMWTRVFICGSLAGPLVVWRSLFG